MSETAILYVLLAVCIVVIGVMAIWTIFREKEIAQAARNYDKSANSLIKNLSMLDSQIKGLMGLIDKSSYADEMQSRELRQMLGMLETRMLDAICRLSDSVSRMGQFGHGNSVHVDVSRDSDRQSTFNGAVEGDAKVNAGDGTFMDTVVEDKR